MNHLAVFGLCLMAFAALALAMERHQQDVFGHVLKARVTRWLRLAGWGALALALWVAVYGQGWALGLVSYSGHTSLGAGLVFCALLARKQSRARDLKDRSRRGLPGAVGEHGEITGPDLGPVASVRRVQKAARLPR